jgi:hypothetical protein
VAWPLSLGTRFRRQSRALKGTPLAGKGIDCSARPKQEALHAKNGKMRLAKGGTPDASIDEGL